MRILITYANLWRFLFIITLSLRQYVLANVWSWILNEPIQQHSDSLSLSNNQTDMSADRPHIHAQLSTMSPCSSQKSCGRGKFCDSFYGRCERLRRRGEFCRKDFHCQRKHECVFGRCRKEIFKGQEGGRCASDGDCGTTQCCARQHGEYVCKLKLKQSMKCFVPAGGLDYSLNEQCPCEQGLICRYEPQKPSTASPSSKKSQKEWFQFSSDTEQMRCLPVNSWSSNTEDYADTQESDIIQRDE